MTSNPYQPPSESSSSMREQSTVRRVAIVVSIAASVIGLALAFYIFCLAQSRVSPGEWRQDMDTMLIVIYIGSAIGFAISAIAFRYGFFYTGLFWAAVVLLVAVVGPFVFDPSRWPAEELFR